MFHVKACTGGWAGGGRRWCESSPTVKVESAIEESGSGKSPAVLVLWRCDGESSRGQESEEDEVPVVRGTSYRTFRSADAAWVDCDCRARKDVPSDDATGHHMLIPVARRAGVRKASG